ncbi:GGDEF domain-containing protein [Actinoplanes sp. NPDC023714]|uniref:GGDEF domain-containing protein n=1 Tax=Actinoplanes sp. NPDC023714 TaxID=3154322 RepID=UPI0033E782E2
MTRICLGLFAVAAAWFAVNLITPVGPPALLWATMPLYGPLVSAVFWRTSRQPALPAPTRRFWRHLTPVPLLVSAGQTAQAADVLTNPAVRTSYTGPVMLLLDGGALLCLSYALIRLPMGRSRPGAATRTALDAGAVALAAAVFIWHFGTRQAVHAGVTPGVAASLVLAVLAILAVFALAKAVLADYAAIDGRGLRLLAFCVLSGALLPMLQPVIAGVDGRLYVAQISLPMIFCVGAYAARSQWTPAAAKGRAKRRRAYSVLPYAAVAAVDGLLLWEVWQHGDDLLAVALCAVQLTALVAIRQITALRDNDRLLARLDHAASHDGLTGLGNRALFHRRLDAALATGDGHPVQVALIDLDGFKQVNDTLGHEAGDLLLVTVAAALRSCVRPGDTAARLGGDEFVLVLDGADRAEADRMAARLTEALHEPVVAGGRRLQVRASIGIAGGLAGDDPATLLRRADEAMYAAKKLTGTAHLHAA